MDTQHGTVVVIEDDPHIADLVDLYLRRDGYRVLLARDADQGLTLIRQEEPWIVILDVGLPGELDGFDVCRRIRANGNLPVLFLTARDDEVDRILGLELGADDYLVKPFSPGSSWPGSGQFFAAPGSSPLRKRSSASETSRWTSDAVRPAAPGRLSP